MERTVPISVLTVCVIFTALVTTLVFMIITCFTMRMRRFNITYQIERDQIDNKYEELRLKDQESTQTQRRAMNAGYGKDDIETLAPYYAIDLRGNLEKKVKSDQEEAQRKKIKRISGWFNKTIAEVAAPTAPRVNEEDRIKQQLEAHQRLQNEQLQASYAQFHPLRSGQIDSKKIDFAAGEVRSQAAELDFMNKSSDKILPIHGRSPRMSPIPSALGSPMSNRSMSLTDVPLVPIKMTSPNVRHQRYQGGDVRPATAEGRLRDMRPGTSGSGMNSRDERQNHGYGYGFGYGRDEYNPNHVL